VQSIWVLRILWRTHGRIRLEIRRLQAI